LGQNSLRCARLPGASSDLAVFQQSFDLAVFGLGHFDFTIRKNSTPPRIPDGLIRWIGLAVVCLFLCGFNSRSAPIDFDRNNLYLLSSIWWETKCVVTISLIVLSLGVSCVKTWAIFGVRTQPFFSESVWTWSFSDWVIKKNWGSTQAFLSDFENPICFSSGEFPHQNPRSYFVVGTRASMSD